jgi:hypothetical protein
MEELTVGEKALRQTVLRGSALNVLWAVLIGGVLTAAIFTFISAGWLRWALFLPILLWVAGCIRVAIIDFLSLREQEATRKSTDPCQASSEVRSAMHEQEQDVVPVEWLGRKTSVEEAEAEFTKGDGRLHPETLDKWRSLVSKMQSGDELRYFSSPGPFLAQYGGYALVRDGTVVDSIMTWIS